MCVYVYVCVCKCVCLCVCMCNVYIYIYVCIYKHVYIYVYLSTAQEFIYLYIHTYIYIIPEHFVDFSVACACAGEEVVAFPKRRLSATLDWNDTFHCDTSGVVTAHIYM